MSPIDTHEEPWLRDALGSLLVDEPPMPPAAVVDDVRRGAVALTAVKRRRTASLAIAAVVLAVAVPVGLVLRAAPNASAPPATSITSAPKVAGVSQEWLDRVSPAVTANTAGWVVDWPSSTVTGDVATGLTLDLALVQATVTGGSRPVVALPTPPYPQTATLRVELLPAGKGPGAALTSCVAATCPRDLPDRKFPTYLDVVAKAGNGAAFPAGTAILDRSYDAGRFVELVSLPPVSTGSGASDAATGAVMPYPFAGAFLDAIGAPTPTEPEPDRTPTPVSFTPPSIDAALAGTEWMVAGQPQPLSSTPSWAYLIRPVEAPASASANVMVFVGRGAGPGPYLASCTPATCPGDRAVVIVDGATAASGYEQTSTVVGDGLLVPAGSLVIDRVYGTGTVVEVVVTPPLDAAREPRVAVPARAVLTSEETSAIVALIEDPLSPQASPSPSSSRFVANADWEAAVVAALPGTATALDGGGVSPETASAIVNVRLVRDGVGTFVRVRIDTPTEGYSSPLDADPCADQGPSACTVLMPWETATVRDSPVASSVIQVEHPAPPSGQQSYAGAYTTRSVVLVQGRTVLTILSDSRDVDAAGGWTSSSSPGLAIDELLPIARGLPLPYLVQPAAESPLWTSKS